MSEQCDGCHADATHALCDQCLDDEGRDALRARGDKLAAALQAYGAHSLDCGDASGCTCGLDAVLAEVEP